METALVKVNAFDAREHFLEYKATLTDRSPEDDKLIAETYRQIARGARVLDLYQTMRNAGANANGLPLLAICRADGRTCTFSYSWPHPQFRCERTTKSYGHDIRKREYVRLPPGTLGQYTYTQANALSGRALVPSIPPALRPKTNLHRYDILWEAVWDVAPPKDPLLLRHIGKNLYSIVASWDLTEVERAVLAGRL